MLSRSMANRSQDKGREIAFFNRHAEGDEYNVFSPTSTEKLVTECLRLADLHSPAKVADLGCGSGVFSSVLAARGFQCFGVDIAHGLTARGHALHPEIAFFTADIEALPFASQSLDGVLLSGVIHHFSDPTLCASEVYRVLKPGGVFAAFDPNRMNPFMFLYRDRCSPFYSSKGVTANERPVLASDVKKVFSRAGFEVRVAYLSGLSYRYVASLAARLFLPAYNLLDSLLFRPGFLQAFRAFVLTAGVKPGFIRR